MFHRRRRTREQSVFPPLVQGSVAFILYVVKGSRIEDSGGWVYSLRLGISEQSGGTAVLFLKMQDCLLAEENKELPFARHCSGVFKRFDFVQNVKTSVFVRTHVVLISHPQGKVVIRPVKVVKAICRAV